MISKTVVIEEKTVSWLTDYLPVILLFTIALGIRSYRLTINPLWLDEIYSFILGQKGLTVILQNSLHDPHPPFYYLFQWVASGFGSFRNEWAWRWPSVLFGSLTVPLVYVSASRITNRLCAFLAAGMLAISPSHLYFSQEARVFAFSCFLAALSPMLIWRIRRQPQGKGAWIGLALLTVLGMYSTYSYTYIGFVQMAYLAICFPKSRLQYLYSAIVVISFLPLVKLMLLSLGSTLEYHANNPAITLFMVAQSMLAGESLRYGLTGYHILLPPILGIFAVPGIWIYLNCKETGCIGPYHVMQLILPLVGFVLGARLINARLPVNESKQFMNLLPVLFISVSGGLYFFQQRLPTIAFVIVTGFLIGVVIAGSVSGLKRYWSTNKSPEGLAVLLVKERVLDGDAIVSTHYSLDAALSFYFPNENVYTKPRVVGNQIILSDNSLEAANPDRSLINNHEISLGNVRTLSRLWLLTRPEVTQSMDQQISRGCDHLEVWYFPPFQVELLTNCTN